MHRRPRATLLATALALIVAGCGPAALPEPTKQPVAESDLIGRWRYYGDSRRTTIEIEFTADHKFTQTVVVQSGASKTQQGTWSLAGANVTLHNVLMHMSPSGSGLADWTPEYAGWWFTDSGSTIQLYGGDHPDPDACWPLERLK